MIFRHRASRLVLKLTACLVVACGCAFVGCSSDYGTSPSNKERMKDADLDGPAVLKKGSKGGTKVYTKSVKSKLFKGAPAE